MGGESAPTKALTSLVFDGSLRPPGYKKERNGCLRWPFSNHRTIDFPFTTFNEKVLRLEQHKEHLVRRFDPPLDPFRIVAHT